METRFENERVSGPAGFRLSAPFASMGDQPEAIDAVCRGFEQGAAREILQGVTGSGKTFTMANVIARLQKPTLVISHNKTLAAQLYAELKGFFPDNAVEYFISYYDYYQPEAYIPQTDTYIEKDASINEDLERFRLAASHALLGRRDTIIVASVSCIYGLLSPEDYRGLMISLHEGQEIVREDLMAQLTEIQYTRNDYEPKPGVFRVRGDVLDIFPSYSTEGIRVSFFGDEIESLKSINAVTGRVAGSMPSCLLSPAKQFVMPKSQLMGGVERIKEELRERLAELDRDGKLLEGQRLRQRTEYDLAMLAEMGYCTGIENYSAPLAGRAAGVPPPTLIDYFGGDFLCIIDESHVTLPQIRAMYNGDQARKQILVDNGFRLVLRPTDDYEGMVQMQTFAPGGLSRVPEEDYAYYEGLAGYMELDGIEGIPDDVYHSVLAENGIGLLLGIEAYWHGMIASAPASSARLMFNLVYERMMHPSLDYEGFEEIRQEELENFGEESYLTKLMKTDWSRQLGMKVDSLMGNVMYGRREATVEDLDRMSLDDMASMYRKLYSNPDGMTCVICGSFDPDSLLAAAVPLFGTMESAGSPNAMGESHFSLPSQKRMLEFPQVNDSQISFDYLQFGHYEPSLKNTLKLKLVRDVIRDRLITVLRERESLVYSPYISLYSKVFDDGIYYFDINAAVSPENTAKAIEVIDTILEDLQKNKISRKELSTLQRTFIVNKRNHLEEESTTNWKNYLVDEIKLGEKLEDIEEYERVLGSISPAELREAFREYIDRDRFIILSLGEFNMD